VGRILWTTVKVDSTAQLTSRGPILCAWCPVLCALFCDTEIHLLIILTYYLFSIYTIMHHVLLVNCYLAKLFVAGV